MTPHEVHLHIRRLVIDASAAAGSAPDAEWLARAVEQRLAGLWGTTPAADAPRAPAWHDTLAQTLARRVGAATGASPAESGAAATAAHQRGDHDGG